MASGNIPRQAVNPIGVAQDRRVSARGRIVLPCPMSRCQTAYTLSLVRSDPWRVPRILTPCNGCDDTVVLRAAAAWRMGSASACHACFTARTIGRWLRPWRYNGCDRCIYGRNRLLLAWCPDAAKGRCCNLMQGNHRAKPRERRRRNR